MPSDARVLDTIVRGAPDAVLVAIVTRDFIDSVVK